VLRYDYARRGGVLPISWDRFGELCRELAVRVAPYAPEAVVGIARGGWLPATVLACMLRCELYPMRLSRRQGDRLVHHTPQILVPPPAQVAGRRVLLVDEIADTGVTLALGARTLKRAGAADLRTAVLVCHSWASPRPDFVALETEAFVINPWEREVVENGVVVLHPEAATALASVDQQGRGG
jgi:hypoxanthine phosphoribosyltransferase